MKIKFTLMMFLIIFFLSLNKSLSEPFVVLDYRNGFENHEFEASANPFINDFNYSSKHIVKKDETLSDIILKYYGSNKFNKDILSLSIIHYNHHAFVRKNPNYLFANKKLYLPSINEMKNLIIKKSKKNQTRTKINKHIYFFGG